MECRVSVDEFLRVDRTTGYHVLDARQDRLELVEPALIQSNRGQPGRFCFEHSPDGEEMRSVLRLLQVRVEAERAQ